MFSRVVQQQTLSSLARSRTKTHYFSTYVTQPTKNIETTLQELRSRGLVKDLTNPNFGKILENEKNVSVYVGYDPTAESLHIGNLLSLITLTHFKNAGLRPIALVSLYFAIYRCVVLI
jgi:hypothetical protein